MIAKSLGDYIVDRTESLDDELINQFFIDRNDDMITRLLDSEQYLLEGSRGIGKTMLMRNAVIESRKKFGQSSVLSVWISFEESIRVERIKVIDSTIDPFLQWTMGKILNEVLGEITKIKPTCVDKLSDRLSEIFGTELKDSSKIKFYKYSIILNDYIQTLEKGDIEDNKLLKSKLPSTELGNILDNPNSFKKFLLGLIEDFQLERIVLLFDEAAHVFSHNQQEKFFTLFKSLRHPQIACKAAVYPGITNYGKFFEKGQDAKELRITWSSQNDMDIKYIREIIKVRIQNFSVQYWEKLTMDSKIINILCICSNGNPRFAFHIIDELKNIKTFEQKSISMKTLINCIRTVVETKWKEFDTLKQRLIRYKSYIQEAENIMKNLFIPNLREWNNKQRKSNRKLAAGFYISTTVYDQISKIFDTLAYSNLIMINNSKKSLGKDQYGYYVSVNPALLFSDLIIRDENEMHKVVLAIEYNQAYFVANPEIKLLIDNMKEENEYSCSNSKCSFVTQDDTFMFCPKCGNPIRKSESESLYKILRSHSVDNLKLSLKIIIRLKERFLTVGEVYDADVEDIKMRYIKEVRSEQIKNAAIEYMAG